MKNSDLNIALLIGSIRKERRTIGPAKQLVKLLRAKGLKVKVLDLQALDLPMFDDGIKHRGRTTLLNTFKKMDGLILVSPEYNRSLPSPVKNAIDYARDGELKNKPLALASTSNGGFGGVRMADAMRAVWQGVGGITTPAHFATSKLSETDWKKPDEKWLERADAFLDEALWWFRVITTGLKKEKR